MPAHDTTYTGISSPRRAIGECSCTRSRIMSNVHTFSYENAIGHQSHQPSDRAARGTSPLHEWNCEIVRYFSLARNLYHLSFRRTYTPTNRKKNNNNIPFGCHRVAIVRHLPTFISEFTAAHIAIVFIVVVFSALFSFLFIISITPRHTHTHTRAPFAPLRLVVARCSFLHLFFL